MACSSSTAALPSRSGRSCLPLHCIDDIPAGERHNVLASVSATLEALKDAFASGNFTEEEADIFVTDLCLWKALRGMRPDQRLRVSSPSGKPIPYRRGVNWWKIKNPAYTQAEDDTS